MLASASGNLAARPALGIGRRLLYFERSFRISWEAPGPPWRYLAGVFLEVDMRSASSVLLIALMGRVDLGVALLPFFSGFSARSGSSPRRIRFQTLRVPCGCGCPTGRVVSAAHSRPSLCVASLSASVLRVCGPNLSGRALFPGRRKAGTVAGSCGMQVCSEDKAETHGDIGHHQSDFGKASSQPA